MCMLFVYYNSECKDSEQYRLILVNVRDEYWDRPTLPAHFWGSHGQRLSGVDEKGGGTWFGVSKTGKIGILLNVLQPNPDPNASSRGSFVSDFLKSPLHAHEYLTNVCDDNKKYNQFNLLLMHISDLKPTLHIMSNWEESEYYRKPSSLDINGVHVFGNCKVREPWIKVKDSVETFKDITDYYTHTKQRDELVQSIISMLHNQTLHLSDPELKKQSCNLDSEMSEALSAVYVWAPTNRYGSRTHTIFLMDSEGNCEYLEKTMVPPPNHCTPNNVQWQTQNFHFQINSDAIQSNLNTVNSDETVNSDVLGKKVNSSL